MKRLARALLTAGLIGLAVLSCGAAPWAQSREPDAEAVSRGRYLSYAGACGSCHTDHIAGGAFLAGGRRIETHLGKFFVPNITPDADTGLGRWTFADFRRAMLDGIAPDGSHYYPTFPYPWYTGLFEEDLADLWAYLRSVPPAARPREEHALPFPLNIRSLIWAWKLFNFTRRETVSDLDLSPTWNRGAYLVNHLGHCGACHTPKDYFFNFLDWRFLGGAGEIPGPYPAPNITPHVPSGIGSWSHEDVARAMRRAMRPDGLPIRGAMAEYVHAGSSFLTGEDLDAIAEYLLSVRPVEGELRPGEARQDERLQLRRRGGQEGGTEGEPAGTGSVGSALLMLSNEGRTRAK